jgi:two-component system KDP operon response regulator KdpE
MSRLKFPTPLTPVFSLDLTAEMESPPVFTVLALEDDVSIKRLLKASFEGTHYRLIEAATTEVALQMLAKRRPSVVLVEMELADEDAFAFIAAVRSVSKVPMIIMGGNDEKQVKIKALEAGADDYVGKPLVAAELLSKIDNLLHHSTAVEATSGSVITCGKVKIDTAGNMASIDDQPLQLTAIEYKLLVIFAKHAGRIITHRQLLNLVWGPQYSEEAQYLRVYLGFLRKKLEPEEGSPPLLLTEPHAGYRLAC